MPGAHRPHHEPVDPDVPREPSRPGSPPPLSDIVRQRGDVLAVIAAGGALGSLGRWGLGELLAHEDGRFAWSTFVVNVTGALLIGLLMAIVVELLATARYVRPFLGVGVLGGWTTFSTYMLDTRAMLAAGHVPTALIYLGGTLVVGLAGTWLGLAIGRLVVGHLALGAAR